MATPRFGAPRAWGTPHLARTAARAARARPPPVARTRPALKTAPCPAPRTRPSRRCAPLCSARGPGGAWNPGGDFRPPPRCPAAGSPPKATSRLPTVLQPPRPRPRPPPPPTPTRRPRARRAARRAPQKSAPASLSVRWALSRPPRQEPRSAQLVAAALLRAPSPPTQPGGAAAAAPHAATAGPRRPPPPAAPRFSRAPCTPVK
ncbi:MAG: hypothetical protein J3K34DRAFT_522917 [Monoraphidium minutum]|nr:MAG: hypothetical protein J3K34DRAFT_522917 [Monoraphidium minutum]